MNSPFGVARARGRCRRAASRPAERALGVHQLVAQTGHGALNSASANSSQGHQPLPNSPHQISSSIAVRPTSKNVQAKKMGWKNPPTQLSRKRQIVAATPRYRQAVALSRALGRRPCACQNPAPRTTSDGDTMGFLAGKRLLITGVLSTAPSPTASPAPATAKGPNWPSATQGERFKERIAEFAAEFGSTLIFDCDVGDDAQIERAVRRTRQELARVRRLRPLDRLRAARGDRRRLPRRPDARDLPHRARHLGLQLSGHGQGRRCRACAAARHC